MAFIESACGDAKTYLANKIETEVRKQKNEPSATLALPTPESTTDITSIAASAAAATATTVAQAAIQQLGTEQTA